MKANEWVSEDCTEHAQYVPEVNAVKYTQPSSDDDGAPRFVTVWLDKAVVRDILDLFPKEDQ